MPRAHTSGRWFSPLSLWRKFFPGRRQLPFRRPDRSAPLGVELLERRELLDAGGWKATLISGVDQYLQDVASQLSVQPFHQKLPVVGDVLAQATGATFINSVHNSLLATLNTDLNAATTDTTQQVAQVTNALNDALGVGGLNVLQGAVTADTTGGHEQFNVTLQSTKFQVSTPLDFSQGLSYLNLKVNGSAQVALQYTWQLGFGLDSGGFYGDTSAGQNGTAQDFVISATAGLKGLQATGTMGVFQLDVTDSTDAPTAITLSATAGLTNFAKDDHYRVGGATKLQFDDLSIGSDVNVTLPMVLSIQGSDAIPRLKATLHFENTRTKSLSSATEPDQPDPPTTFEFDDVGVDLGTFVNNFLRPATQFLDKPLSDINWLIDDQPTSVDGTPTGFFYSPLSILQNISFVNALTPRQILGDLENLPEVGPVIKAFDISIDALAKLNDFVKALNASATGENVWIDFGDFAIKPPSDSGGKGPSATQTRAPKSDPESQASADEASGGDTNGGNATGSQLASDLFAPPQVNQPQFEFPIFTDPLAAISLILGNYSNADLFDFTFTNNVSINADLPGGIQNIVTRLLSDAPQSVQDTVGNFLDLLPVQVNYDINLQNLHLNTNLKAGFDASGLAQFAQTGDPADILKGFFIGSGQVLDVGGSIDLSANVTVKDPITQSRIFTASAGGGVSSDITMTVNDPNQDGKLTLSEINQITGGSAANLGRLFAVSGNLSYNVNADVAFLPGSANWHPPGLPYSASGTLFDFSTGGSIGTINAAGVATDPNGNQTTLAPVLATLGTDGTLTLNMGPKATDRIFSVNGAPAADGDESFHLSATGPAGAQTVNVTFNGVTQTYTSVKSLVAQGGTGNDTITVSGFLGPMNLSGGDGADVLDVRGSSGPATLDGGAGNNTLWGGSGSDTLLGGAGNDSITGGSGTNVIHGGGGADTLDTGSGTSQVYADGGNASIRAHFGSAFIDGGTGTSTLTLDTTSQVQAILTATDANQGAGTPDTSYRNISNLFVTLNGTKSTLKVNGTTVPLTVKVQGSQETVTVAALAAAATVNLNSDSDAVVVTGAGATLTILSTGPKNTLQVDRSKDTVSEVGSWTGSTLTGLGLASVSYSNLDSVEVDLGSGANAYTVNGPSGINTATLMGGPADDSFTVLAAPSTAPITISGNSGTDTVTVPFNGTQAGNAYDGLTVGAGVEQVVIDATADAAAITWKAGTTSVTGSSSSGRVFGMKIAGAGQVRVEAAPGSGSTLLVTDQANTPQTDLISGDTVQLNEGAQILSKQGYQSPAALQSTVPLGNVNGLNGVTTSADGKFVYAATNVADLVLVYARDPNTGALTAVQELTLPGSGFFAGHSLALDPSNTYLYVTAGSAGIAVYRRDATAGTLTLIQTIGQGVSQPRLVEVLRDGVGEYLYALGDGLTGSHTDALTVYSRNTSSGLLAYVNAVEEGTADSQGHIIAGLLDGSGLVALAFGTSSPEYIYVASDVGLAEFKQGANGALTAIHDGGTGQHIFSGLAVSPNDLLLFSVDVSVGKLESFRVGSTISSPDDPLKLVNAVPLSGGSATLPGLAAPTNGSVYLTSTQSSGGGVQVNWYSYDTGVGDPGFGQLSLTQSLTSAAGQGAEGVAGNGASVYVTTNASSDSTSSPELLTFSPDNSGNLAATGQAPNTAAVNLSAVQALTFSADGKFAYAVSPTDGAVAVFAAQTGGTLSLVQILQQGFGGIDGLAGATALALSADGKFLVVVSPVENSITLFARDASSGLLTPKQVLKKGQNGAVGLQGASSVAVDAFGDIAVAARGGNVLGFFFLDTANAQLLGNITQTLGLPLSQPSVIAVDPGNGSVYVGNAAGSTPLTAELPDGSVQSFQEAVGGANGIAGPVAIVLAPGNLYVAGQAHDAIAIFARDGTTGALTFLQSVQNGVGGVRGLGGITSVAVSPDGKYLFAVGGDDNAVVVFSRDGPGKLTYLQTLLENVGGAQGLAGPVSVAVSADSKTVYVGSAGDGINPGGLASFSISQKPPVPVSTTVRYSDMSALTVATGGGGSVINLGPVNAPSVTLNAGSGGNQVTVSGTAAKSTTTLNLGNGNNTLDLDGTGNGSTTTVNGGSGADTLRLWATGVNATTTLDGGDGSDSFRISGARLRSAVTVDGGNPTAAPGDTLSFDTQGAPAYPLSRATPNGTVQIGINSNGTVSPNNNFAPVNYSNIEDVELLAAPVAQTGNYAVTEGGTLTMDASKSFPAPPTGSYLWDLNGDGVFGDATGVKPSLTWDQLAQLGLHHAGSYTIRLRVTDAQGKTDETTATLQITNVAPTLASVTSNGPVTAGSPVTVTAGASDPGGAADPLTYEFDFDGSGNYAIHSTSGSASYTYAAAGNYSVGVRVVDGDGATDQKTLVVTVNASVPAVRTISGVQVINQFATYTLGLAASGPGADTISGWAVNWGDGTTSAVAGNPSSVTHPYQVAGAYTVSATATDTAATVASNPWSVAVNAVAPAAPTLILKGPAQIVEGNSYTLALKAIVPAGGDTLAAWVINWGDTTTTQVVGSATAVSHVYQGPGNYTISVVGVGQQASYAADQSVSVKVTDVLPALKVGGLGSVDEGTPYTLSLIASASKVDPLRGWLVSWGDGMTDTLAGSATAATHVYASAAKLPYTISAFAWDGESSAANAYPAGTVSVSVNLVAPTVRIGGAASVDEGSTYTLGLGAFEPNGHVTLGWDINWGDGTTEHINGDPGFTTGLTPSVTHLFADGPASDTITATVTNDEGTFAAQNSVSVQVNNVAPTPAIVVGLVGAPEGTPISLVASATDPSSVDTAAGFRYAWTVTKNGAAFASGSGANFAFTPDDNGSYAVTLAATDKDGGVGTTSLPIGVTNVAPTPVIVGTPASSAEGTAISLTGSATDPSAADTAAGFNYAWTVTKHGASFATGSGAAFSFTPDDNGAYVVSLTAADKDGGASSTSQTVAVTNVAPTPAISGVRASNSEGTAISLIGSAKDPSNVDTAAGFTYVWAVTKNGAAFATGSGTAFSFTPDDNGAYVVSLTATDKDGGASSTSQTIAVANVAPTPVIASAPASSPEGTTISLTGSATDPSAIDTAAGFRYAWTVTKNGAAFASGSGANFAFTPDDNGTYVVTLAATDKDGGVGTTSLPIGVTNVAPTPVIVSAPASSAEGTAINLTGSATDPSSVDTAAGFSYAWTVTKNGGAFAAGSGANFSFTPDDNGTYAVTLTATDKDGGASSLSQTVAVTNVAPTVKQFVGGTVTQGLAGSISFSGQSDPSAADTAAGFRYSYDFNNDGTFEVVDSASASATVPAAYLSRVGQYTVHGRIKDKDGGFTDYTTAVNVVSPAAISGLASGVRGEERVFTLTSPVPGVAYTVAWGDGQTQAVTGPADGSAVQLTHTYSGGLTDTQADVLYTVSLSTAGTNGQAVTVATAGIHIKFVDYQLVPSDLNGGTAWALVVGGSTHNNEIEFESAGTHLLDVEIETAATGLYEFHQTFADNVQGAPVRWVIAYGQASDVITVSPAVTVNAELHASDRGGSLLAGGGGNNILVGGSGSDILFGGSGRDLLIGGMGGDVIVAGKGDDIVIAGQTSYDHNGLALRAILNEWASADSYANRLADILGQAGTGHLNGGYFLNASTVQDDNSTDYLTGGSGQDWFFADTTGQTGPRDVILGLRNNETVTVI